MSQTITVEGMTCEHCEQTVEDAVGEVDGVTGVDADRETESIIVEGEADTDTLVRAVDEAGYDASG